MYIINNAIKGDKFRITIDDKSVILSRNDIWIMAEQQQLDVVLINSKIQPQVVKLMDYGKFMYETTKKTKERLQKQRLTKIHVKQIQLSCRIESHDLNTKAKHANEFLENGDSVEIVLRMRGRETAHKDIAIAVVEKFISMLHGYKPKYHVHAEGRDIKLLMESATKKVT